MSQESIVYGCIKDICDQHDDKRLLVNRRALLALPKADDWPFLSQEMFAIPQLVQGQGRYHTQVMHFGASYKAVEYEWEQWIAKFEELLNKMYWMSATVHLETELSGHHTFSWVSGTETHTPGSDDMKVRCEWSYESSILSP